MSLGARLGRRGRFIGLLLLVVGISAFFVTASTPAAQASSPLAPNFSLPDIYGHNFTLSSYRGTHVVVVEFTSLSCSECQIVEQSLMSLYSNYNQSGTSDVIIASVYTQPQFGDSISALRAYHNQNHVTWTMAQDTPSDTVTNSYGADAIPVVVIIDKQGHAVYDVAGAQSTAQLHATISSALAGTATTISIVTIGVFALAAVAGVSTFFSPCAFPMFPGYMGLYLGLDTTAASSRPTYGGTYRGAVRRALSAGSATAMGMIVVFLVIGVALVLAASLISGYIPYLLIIVGVALIGLGLLLFTNLQYWKVIAPLQRLWARMRGIDPEKAASAPTAASGRGFYLKLFGYGMGYAAAAAGCVAPVILSAIVAGLALGLVGGIINILIYSATAAALMIAVTVLLALAGKRFVNQLKAYTPLIKKVSAGVLIVVGAYLVYFYDIAWLVRV